MVVRTEIAGGWRGWVNWLEDPLVAEELVNVVVLQCTSAKKIKH